MKNYFNDVVDLFLKSSIKSCKFTAIYVYNSD